MAIGVSLSVAGYTDNSDGTVYTSTSTWTPSVGDVIVGFIQASGTTAAAPTLTGGGLTWTLQTSATSNSGANTCYCYTTSVSSALLITPVFTCTADAATGVCMSFLTFTGANTTTPVVQTKIKNSTTGSNPTITFDSNLNTNNGYAMAVACAANTPGVTAPTNWTESEELGHTAPTDGIEVSYRAGGETGATITATRGSINHGIIGIEIAVASSGAYTMTAAVGTFTLTGVAAGLKAQRLLTAALGTFTLTGVAAALNHGYKMVAALGTFALTGVAATLTAQRKLTAALGTFVITGVDTALNHGYKMLAAVGEFLLTGNDASILRGVKLVAGTGTFTLTGNDAGLKAGRYLASGRGEFVLTGNDVTFIYTPAGSFLLMAEVGTFNLTGNPASFVYVPVTTESPFHGDIGPGDYSTIRKYFPLRGELKRKRLPKAAIAKIKQVAELHPTSEQLETLSADLVPMASPSDLVQMAIRMEMAINEAMEQIYAEALAKEIAAKRVEEAIAKERARVLTEAIAYYLQVLEDDEILLLHII